MVRPRVAAHPGVARCLALPRSLPPPIDTEYWALQPIRTEPSLRKLKQE